MKVGAIEIYRNAEFFAKVEWMLYKIFKIKRSMPCGRTRKENYLCCELTPTVKNSYVEFDDYGFEIKCKVCGNSHMMSTYREDVLNIQDAIDCYYGKGKFNGEEW